MNYAKNSKRSIIIHSVLAMVLLLINYLLELPYFDTWDEYTPYLKKLMISVFLISIIYICSKILSRIILKQNYLEGEKYNLIRIIRLVSLTLSFIVVTSFLFHNLYAAAVSFGLLSIIIGFALQAPIASFIGWIYLILRRTYLVGDRIQIKNFRGDVIEISYLDTSILECNGDYLGNDRMSGRIVRFPNSLILKEEVINYSGPENPFIWNEIPIQVAYTSDLEFIEKCLLEASERDFLERYPNYKNSPNKDSNIYFRVNKYAWIEAVITYAVMPNDTSKRRNKILKYALSLLNESPEKVKFPEGTSR